MQLQRKFWINMTNLMTTSRLLPLNVDRFFALVLRWKVVGAWSKMLKHSSEHRVRHCGELCKCLKILRGPMTRKLFLWSDINTLHTTITTFEIIKLLTEQMKINYLSECSRPLGMENQLIPDYAITASTEVRNCARNLLSYGKLDFITSF